MYTPEELIRSVLYIGQVEDGGRVWNASSFLVRLDRANAIDPAVELAQKLSHLGVGQSAPFVREALRANNCFSQPCRGRWQVGCLPKRSSNTSSRGSVIS
jgi:hypothetical protein